VVDGSIVSNSISRTDRIIRRINMHMFFKNLPHWISVNFCMLSET
jgi:hypothetical protein